MSAGFILMYFFNKTSASSFIMLPWFVHLLHAKLQSCDTYFNLSDVAGPALNVHKTRRLKLPIRHDGFDVPKNPESSRNSHDNGKPFIFWERKLRKVKQFSTIRTMDRSVKNLLDCVFFGAIRCTLGCTVIWAFGIYTLRASLAVMQSWPWVTTLIHVGALASRALPKPALHTHW